VIRFGTSSWIYEGWKGQIYKKAYKSEKQFKEEALAEYAKHPQFKTVSLDHTFYTPPKKEKLELYSSQVPEDFKFVAKVWEEITIPVFPNLPKYGSKKGSKNSNFLSEALLIRFLEPFFQSEIRKKMGVFVFQFPSMSINLPEVLGDLLLKLPKEFNFAVEIRNKEFLGAEYFDLLNQFNVAHCFNHWFRMPGLKFQMEQAARAGGLKSEFFIARLLTPLGLSYENAVKKFSPYNEIKEVQSEMREDVKRLIKRGTELKKETFILVNNRCEGNAPLTIEALST